MHKLHPSIHSRRVHDRSTVYDKAGNQVSVMFSQQIFQLFYCLSNKMFWSKVEMECKNMSCLGLGGHSSIFSKESLLECFDDLLV